MKRLCFASSVVLLALTSVSAAQSYPAKPVRLVLPYSAGSNADTVARIIAQKLGESWGKPVIVENRAAGSAGIIGNQAVLTAPADGYTLLLGATGSMSIAPSLYKLPYDTTRDFDAITLLAYVPNVLVVNKSLPVRNVKELVALAKSQPDKVAYASSASGSISHLAGEVFNWRAGVKLRHIPYKGSPAALNALLSGEVALMYSPVPLALPHIKSGRLRALGVTTAKRSATLPDVPTIAEAGLKGYQATQWYGLFARAGTPKEIITRISGDVGGILRASDVRASLASLGSDPVATTPDQLAALIKAEIAQWAPIVKASGASPD